jgi:hypothetical protein
MGLLLRTQHGCRAVPARVPEKVQKVASQAPQKVSAATVAELAANVAVDEEELLILTSDGEDQPSRDAPSGPGKVWTFDNWEWGLWTLVTQIIRLLVTF